MSMICLYAYLVIVSVWDGITYRIPNALTMTGALLGIGLAFYEKGWAGLKTSASSFLITLVLLFALWMFLEATRVRAIGAGDMKLVIILSLFIGAGGALTVFYYSLIVGSLLFLFITPPRKINEMFTRFLDFAVYTIPSKPEQHLRKIAFSIPIFISLLLHNHVFN